MGWAVKKLPFYDVWIKRYKQSHGRNEKNYQNKKVNQKCPQPVETIIGFYSFGGYDEQ
jgi:hypothetical protein